jgi:hypothetical protein
MFRKASAFLKKLFRGREAAAQTETTRAHVPDQTKKEKREQRRRARRSKGLGWGSGYHWHKLQPQWQGSFSMIKPLFRSISVRPALSDKAIRRRARKKAEAAAAYSQNVARELGLKQVTA